MIFIMFPRAYVRVTALDAVSRRCRSQPDLSASPVAIRITQHCVCALHTAPAQRAWLPLPCVVMYARLRQELPALLRQHVRFVAISITALLLLLLLLQRLTTVSTLPWTC